MRDESSGWEFQLDLRAETGTLHTTTNSLTLVHAIVTNGTHIVTLCFAPLVVHWLCLGVCDVVRHGNYFSSWQLFLLD